MATHIVPEDFHQTNIDRSDPKELRFIVHQPQAQKLLGLSPSIHVVLESDHAIFHEAGAFFQETHGDSLFITSNIISDEMSTHNILIHRLTRTPSNPQRWSLEPIPQGEATMANGGIATPSKDGILFCAQGSKTHPGGLVHMSRHAPYATQTVLRTFHGRWFNSTNDVAYAPDGAIWFTDPIYGFEQGFRNKPQLPCQVYRFDPVARDVRVVADGFQRPNGLCFSPDGETVYVTDTDWIHGDGSRDDHRLSQIYAFTVSVFNGAPFLTNRRVFAMADHGAPDGVKCDTQGNVYSGCGDGVNVWNPQGQLILKIVVPGGVANFCIGRPGEILMLNETRFVVANISKDVMAPY